MISSSTSDRTRRGITDPAPARRAARRRQEAGRSVIWFAGSVALHVCVVLLLLLTPVRRIVFERPDPTEFRVTARADRIEEMVERLRQREADRMRETVEEILRTERDVGQQLEERMALLEEFAADKALDAAREADQAQMKALEAQARAMEEQARAVEALEQRETKIETAEEAIRRAQAEFEQAAAASTSPVEDPAVQQKARARDALEAELDRVAKEVVRIQTQVWEAQADAGDAQKEAVRALEFAGPDYSAAMEKQQQANAAQEEASRTQDRAGSLRESVAQAQRNAERSAGEAARDRHNAGNAEERAQKADRAAQKAAEALAGAEPAAKQAEEAREAAETAAEAAAKEAKSALEKAAKTATRADQKAAQDAARQAGLAKRRAEGAAKAAAKAQGDLERRRAEQARASAAAEAARKQAEAAKRAAEDGAQRAERNRQSHADLVEESKSAQRSAAAQQASARKAQLAAAAALRRAAEGEATGAAEEARPVPATARADQPGLEGKDLAELYRQAVGAEARITEAYREIRATDAAMSRGVPYSEALKDSVVAKPSRPKLDEALLTEPVRTGSRAEAHRDEVAKANREIASIADNVRRIADQARTTGIAKTDEGVTLSLAEIKAAAQQANQVTEMGREQSGARYTDLTAAMKAAAQAAEGEAAKPAQGIATAVAQGLAGAPTGASSGRQGAPGQSHAAPFQTSPHTMRATAARRIGASIDRQPPDDWVYVDTWYTIGPFPNPGRRNIDTPFIDPQHEVDLDEVRRAEGKDGRDLRWRFVKSPYVVVRPADDEPYGIYYAYTELWFEEAMDLEIAVGSDDNARLWINGFQVWTSARHLKPWRANEQYRLVHFRKGLNHILYRVENGHGATAFSLMICMKRPA